MKATIEFLDSDIKDFEFDNLYYFRVRREDGLGTRIVEINAKWIDDTNTRHIKTINLVSYNRSLLIVINTHGDLIDIDGEDDEKMPPKHVATDNSL